MKPPFTYFGGKTTLADRIVEVLPDHLHYIEPFAGSLAVLLAKQPSKLETVNDLDQDLMTFWRVLRDQPEDLAAAAALTPHSRAEYLACQDLEASNDLERARRVWVRLSQGRGGMLRTTGWRFYADPHGTSTPMPGYLHGYVERMPPAAWRLRQVSLECRPALDVIADYGKHPDALIYADPPYLGTTRGWGNQYRHELRAEVDHRTLAEALRECTAAVVLSGYSSPLYDELYGDWDRKDFAAFTGNGTEGKRTEVLWSNRPLAREDRLFDDMEAS